jgi:hypothetical protein
MKEKKKEEINIVPSTKGLYEIGGKKYYVDRTEIKVVDGIDHEDKVVLKEFDEKEFEELSGKIIKEIGKQVTKDELIKELIKGHPMNELRNMAKAIEEKQKVVKHRGCLGFKIGDCYIQLYD